MVPWRVFWSLLLSFSRWLIWLQILFPWWWAAARISVQLFYPYLDLAGLNGHMCNSMVIQVYGQSLYATYGAFLWLILFLDSPPSLSSSCVTSCVFSDSSSSKPAGLLLNFSCSMVMRQEASLRCKTHKI